MPEGHTIHRLARDHSRSMGGQRLACSSPQGRFAVGAAAVDGARLAGVDAHGKHLFYRFDANDGSRLTVHVHLGLYGKFRPVRVPAPEPRGQVRWRAMGEERGFDLNGPSACELMGEDREAALRARLGQDPLDPRADVQAVRDRVSKSRAPIGTLLLDQSVFAGVGNIFRADVLHAAAVHPRRLGRDLSGDEFDAIWSELVRTMRLSERHNRIITARPPEGRTAASLKRGERLLIYKAQRCPATGGPVEVFELAGRACYASPEHQPEHPYHQPEPAVC